MLSSAMGGLLTGLILSQIHHCVAPRKHHLAAWGPTLRQVGYTIRFIQSSSRFHSRKGKLYGKKTHPHVIK